MLRLRFFLIVSLFTNFLSAQEPQRIAPMVSSGTYLGTIPPLRDLTPVTIPAGTPLKVWQKWNHFPPNVINNPDALPQGPDPLVDMNAERSTGPELEVDLNLEGLRDGAVSPPDPNGDVGKNHYIQAVNSASGAKFRIWDKQGNSVYGPAATNTLWNQVGSSSIGDPIIQYDPGAERWIMMEMQGIGNGELLLAISDDHDPTGGWKAYRFQTLGFPDYPKLYIWPDAYFVTVNEIVNGNQCSGYALEKSAILAGTDAFQVHRFELPKYPGISFQPATGADWDGGAPPPPGSPGYLFRVYDDAWNGGADQIQIFEVYVNWQDLSQSFLDGPSSIYTAPFETRVCFSGLFDCLEQPGAGAPRITALENIIMHRAAYRNFGSHEAVVFNHIADVSGQTGAGGDAAVRWYELRKTGNEDWSIYQQGTFAPDLATNRFMGTLAFDEAGNIGLGYSVVSNTVFPGLRLTGRRASDPLGQMPIEEYTLQAGSVSHTGDQRWGDYSSMSIDPEDGKTFWFTGEYQPNNANWGTRIGTFRIQRDSFDVSPTELLGPLPNATVGAPENVSVRVLNGGINPAQNVSLQLWFNNVLVATEQLPGIIASEQSVDYTFNATVDMPVVGQTYPFMIVSQWTNDNFTKNDTLRSTVKKLTAHNAGIAGRFNLSGLLCADAHTFGFIVENYSGLPLNSVELRWKLNTQAQDTVFWTGNLQPGERDTVMLTMTNINDGLNNLRAHTAFPNGFADQETSDDSTSVKFFGNLGGTYLSLEGTTEFGVLQWELRAGGSIVGSGQVASATSVVAPICTDDNTCYKLIYRASTLSWQGDVKLYDIYNNVLASVKTADNQKDTVSFCTPARVSVDAGVIGLVSPVSDPGLGNSEAVTVRLRNFGTTPLTDVQVRYNKNSGNQEEVTETIPGTIQPQQTVTHTFNTAVDLSDVFTTIHPFVFRTLVPGDEQPNNDLYRDTLYRRADYDIALQSLDLYTGCSDTAKVEMALLFQNNGALTAQTLELAIRSNGFPETYDTININLAPGKVGGYYFKPDHTVYGTNNLELAIRSIDGVADTVNILDNSLALVYAVTEVLAEVEILFAADNNPDETIWQLLGPDGSVIASGGPYILVGLFQYTPGICVDPNHCYTMRFIDSGGNGFNGFVNITIEGYTGFQVFGFETDTLDVPFCLQDQCGNFAVTADATPASAVGANDGLISLTFAGGTAPYEISTNGTDYVSATEFTGLAAGIYTVYARDANGCVKMLSVVVEVASSTVEVWKNAKLTVTPNPTDGLVRLYLSVPSHIRDAEVCVTDARGKQLYETRLTRWDDALQGMVSLEKQPTGVYLVIVKVGEKVFVARVVRR